MGEAAARAEHSLVDETVGRRWAISLIAAWSLSAEFPNEGER
jgi:hypothetical protein